MSRPSRRALNRDILWGCSVCEYSNTSNCRICTMCDTPKSQRPLLGNNKMIRLRLKKETWICSLCEYSNSLHTSICDMCATSMYAAKSTLMDSQMTNHFAQCSENALPIFCSTKPRHIASNIVSKSNGIDDVHRIPKHDAYQQVKTWQCHNCRFVNFMDSIYCGCCELQKISKSHGLDETEPPCSRWSCSECTFRNHIHLPYCEICFCPRNSDNVDAKEEEKLDTESLVNNVYVAQMEAVQAAHQKRNDLQSLTSLMSIVFNQTVLNYKQQKIHNMFQDDAIKHLRILLETLFETDGVSKYVRPEEIQRTIDLLIGYWTLFVKSKHIIHSKQLQIDALIGSCNKWHQIVNKKIDGQELADKDLRYMKHVSKSFSDWFECESEMTKMEQKWKDLLGKLQRNHLFWHRKTQEIDDKIQQQREFTQPDVLIQRWQTSLFKMIGKVASAIGKVAIQTAAVIGIVFTFGFMKQRISILAKSGIDAIDRTKQQCDDYLDSKLEQSERTLAEFNRVNENARMLEETFRAMKNDSGKMDKFFADFCSSLKKPIRSLGLIGKYDGKLSVIRMHVKKIVDSLEELKDVCNNMVIRINEKMKQKPDGYSTKQ